MQSGSTPQVQDYFSSLETPDINDMQIQLEQLVQQGVISPEDAETVMQEKSAMNGITLDPRLKQAQMDSLAALADISDSGGMNLTDEANLQRISNEEQTRAKGARDAIIQNAQARGMGGSGLEIMSQLQNAQDAATRASQRDLDVAGMAQQRALDALMQQGQMAGQMGQQDFNQQSQIAQANDAISRFNAQNKQNVINQNVAARNDAQAQNMQNAQQISNANVGLRNQQQMNNKNLLQQNFENELRKRGGQTGVAQQNAANAGRDSQNQANANNQTIGTGITAAATVFGGPAAGAGAAKATHAGQPYGKDYFEYAKDGALVGGPPTEGDSQPYMLQPGELVVKKDDVPDMLKKMHTGDDGDFDVAGFLDQVTGGKYGYSKKRRA